MQNIRSHNPSDLGSEIKIEKRKLTKAFETKCAELRKPRQSYCVITTNKASITLVSQIGATRFYDIGRCHCPAWTNLCKTARRGIRCAETNYCSIEMTQEVI